MRLTRVALPALLALSIAGTASAQQPVGTIVQVTRQKVAPGMAQKYEAGRKKHMDWHRKMADPWTWTIWEVTTGPDSGSYLVTTPNHQWQDFDTWNAKMAEGDGADAALNTVPAVASAETSYWALMPDHSLGGATGDVPPMATLSIYYLKPGAGPKFTRAVRKMTDALKKGNWAGSRYTYVLANGGEVPAYALFIPRKNMADMQLPDPSLPSVVEKELGREEADRVWADMWDSVSRITSEMLVHRADLSYAPAK